jgi:hypothetical protein
MIRISIVSIVVYVVALVGCGGEALAPSVPPPSAGASATAGPAASAAPSVERIECRDALVGDELEPSGIGLYSYILIPRPPTTPEQKDRAIRILKAYFDMSRAGEYTSRGVDPASLNVVYALVTERPPPDASFSPQWILDHYNYVRARIYLRVFGISPAGDGPVLAASDAAIRLLNGESHKFYFDLSNVPLAVTDAWTTEFIKHTNGEQFWKRDGNWALVIRSDLEVLTRAVLDVNKARALLTKALSEWVKMFD